MDSMMKMHHRHFARLRRMPRAFARLLVSCLALVLVTGNLAAAGLPIGAASRADAAQVASAHHHCDGADGMQAPAPAKHATGCACCDGQGCHCLQSAVALTALWRLPAAIPRAGAAFAMRVPLLAQRDIPPHWRPPIA